MHPPVVPSSRDGVPELSPLGRFLHGLRNHMQAVLSNTELLALDTTLTEDQRACALDALEGARRIVRLVEAFEDPRHTPAVQEER